jgi:NitT/TauT family transport system substrate-binding protein
VVAGEGAQTAALLRSKQVGALSQFDTQYAMVENAGQKLRQLPLGEMAPFPGNGLFALEKTLADRHAEAVALGRGLAIGGGVRHGQSGSGDPHQCMRSIRSETHRQG